MQEGADRQARGIAVAMSVTDRPLALVSKRNVVSMATADAPLAITIFVVVAFLWFYSRKSAAQGILR